MSGAHSSSLIPWVFETKISWCDAWYEIHNMCVSTPCLTKNCWIFKQFMIHRNSGTGEAFGEATCLSMFEAHIQPIITMNISRWSFCLVLVILEREFWRGGKVVTWIVNWRVGGKVPIFHSGLKPSVLLILSNHSLISPEATDELREQA